MKQIIKQYAIYNKDKELIDVLELNKTKLKQYKHNNPDYIIEEIFDDFLEVGVDLDTYIENIDGYNY
jgi:hypothetical protein